MNQLAIRCPHCGKRKSVPCTPHGCHLARWIEAWQQGHIAKVTLAEAVAQMTVIAGHLLVPAATEKAA